MTRWILRYGTNCRGYLRGKKPLEPPPWGRAIPVTGTRAIGSRFLGVDGGASDLDFLCVRVALRNGRRVRLGSHAAAPMRVPAVITDQVFALVGDVLSYFGQEIEGAEDLEIAARSASQVGTGRTRKAAAVVLFGAVQHRPVVGQADHPCQGDAISRSSR